MKSVLRFLFVFFLVCSSTKSIGAPVVSQSDSAFLISKGVSFYKIDRLGNIYFVDTKNCLNKFEPSIKRYTKYADLKNGEISSIDISNPLRIVVFFQSQSIVKFLDINLTEINSFQIRNNYSEGWISLVSSSNNNGLWMYDNVNRKIIKTGEKLNTLFSTGDLYLIISKKINPSILFEKSDELFLCDFEKGIFVFDMFGGYKKTIPFTEEKLNSIINSDAKIFNFNCKLNELKELYYFPIN